MRRLFPLLAALAALLLACSGSAWAQIADINAAINKAGRQRMLSQRIAKAYFQIGQNIDVDRSRQVLDGSVALFDRQLVELKNYAPTPEIRETYQHLERVWLAYKDALFGTASNKGGGRTVLGLSDQVLALAHQGTVQLERQSGTPAGHLVGVAGRQRMLSQRTAKYYQALNWGLGGRDATAELDKARGEFVAAHTELTKAAADNRPLRDALDLVGHQWVFFEAALSRRGSDYHATDVAAASELILQEMETAVALFEKQGR